MQNALRNLWISLATFTLAAVALAGPRQEIESRVKVGTPTAQAQATLKQYADFLGTDGYDKAEKALPGSSVVTEAMYQNLEAVLVAREASLAAVQPQVADPKNAAVYYLKQNHYVDVDQAQSKTWAARGVDTFFKWLSDLFSSFTPKPSSYNGPTFTGMDLGWLAPMMWIVIGIVVCGLIWFAATKVGWTSFSRTKKAGGGLADDEPDRTADEWLGRADELAEGGRYREAVRSLYVASLIRLDEAGVARFRKGETNWEHLNRIEASPRKPAGFDFRPPTKRFDIVWYGHKDEGMADYIRFKDWYAETLKAVSRMAA